jgi:dipeptidyl aminopeptidase/acylaminoacyl peptidase
MSASTTSHPLARHNVGFDPHGRYAACLAADPDDDALTIEAWTFAGDTARLVRLPTGPPESFASQLVAVGPARVMVARQQPGAHELAVVSATGGRVRQRVLANPGTPEFRLLAPASCRAPVIALATEADGGTTVQRVDQVSGRLVPLTRVGWPLRDGVWLDPHGRQLGTTRDQRPVLVDLADGSVDRLPTPDDGEAYLLLASPASGRVLLATGAPGALRLEYQGSDGTIGQPSHRLNALAGSVLPLAFDPAGRRLALRVRRGARCHLFVHEIDTDTVTELPIPPGVSDGTAAWAGNRLRFTYRSPTCPAGLATVTVPRIGAAPADRGEAAGWSLHGGTASPDWAPAQLETFAGPAGEIEAVVYGDWRTAAEVVVALHGGPDAAWELDFDPVLQAMAAAGLAVVAPNPRGSTGYGREFRDAIRGRWGGPDLADVLAVAWHLSTRRRGGSLVAYGSSYGAFLALLAGAAAPRLWSRCAAVAPFLSAGRLYEQASPPVRDMLDRLAARGPAATDPDLLERGPRITARLLLVHGEQDEVVPVDQSRTLRHRLHTAGRREGVDFTYVEVPEAGHDPLLSAGQRTALARFLGTGDWTSLRRALPRDTRRDPREEVNVNGDRCRRAAAVARAR